MKRKDFIKSLGLVGFGLTIPTSKVLAANNSNSSLMDVCTLVPTETAGPFPLDLSDNTYYLRQDIRESSQGIQLNLKMKIFGTDNCLSMPNVRINVWQCDNEGNYSGYEPQVGMTQLRGYQMTNAEGEVEFLTNFPGWYNGRVCHIHFQVFVSSSYAAISQFTFDHDTVNAIYNANPTLYPRGVDPITPETDSSFGDGYELQLATLTPNIATGGYDAYLEVAVQGSGTLGVGYNETQASKYLDLQQNFPNPFENETTIPFKLSQPSKVKIELWNLQGQKIKTLNQGNLNSGDHEVALNFNSIGLSTANYLYQIDVENDSGKFKSSKMMTHLKR